MNQIIEEVHLLVNIIRKTKGLDKIEFPDRSAYYEDGFMNELIQQDTEAPNCQCENCRNNPTTAKKVRPALHGGGFNKYAHGHKPADGKVHINKRNASLDGIPTESLFIVKVYTSKEYEAKSSIIDDRILSLLKEVNRSDTDEITCIYPTEEHKKKILKQLQKGVDILKFKIRIDKKHDHIALVKTGE